MPHRTFTGKIMTRVASFCLVDWSTPIRRDKMAAEGAGKGKTGR
jgi:hypothetical protein